MPGTKAQARRRRERRKAWYMSRMAQERCVRCGFTDARALDWHHTDPATKQYNVTDLVWKGSAEDTILREMAKCVVLCCNCHRIVHWEDENGIQGAHIRSR